MLWRRFSISKTLMVQGTTSSAGKTTLVTALCRIFVEKGFSVGTIQSAKHV